jgi:hypothetical protein
LYTFQEESAPAFFVCLKILLRRDLVKNPLEEIEIPRQESAQQQQRGGIPQNNEVSEPHYYNAELSFSHFPFLYGREQKKKSQESTQQQRVELPTFSFSLWNS